MQWSVDTQLPQILRVLHASERNPLTGPRLEGVLGQCVASSILLRGDAWVKRLARTADCTDEASLVGKSSKLCALLTRSSRKGSIMNRLLLVSLGWLLLEGTLAYCPAGYVPREEPEALQCANLARSCGSDCETPCPTASSGAYQTWVEANAINGEIHDSGVVIV